MTSLNWKRKAKLETRVATAFTHAEEEEDEPDVDWLSAAKRPCLPVLEDAETKSKRLQNEGAMLAENERYWEAIKYWDEAIQLTPGLAALHEMKSQVLLELGELFPAVQSGERAVQLDSKWAVARQSLGRAQLGLGELEMARDNFQKAVHLLPADSEIRADLKWVLELIEEKKTRTHQAKESEEKD